MFEVLVEDGRIVLEPKKPVPADQAWYWTKEWQAAEQEARENIAAGRYKTFENAEEFVKDLMSDVRDLVR
ncbi:MAG: hypothetical protein ACYCVD_16435 [Desulfitobacteriaceae bacterium]